MATITKSDLGDHIANVVGLNKAQGRGAVDAAIEHMTSALQHGDTVNLHQFGIFEAKPVPARMGRNPRTGEPVAIAARRAAKFKPSRALKTAIL